MRKIHTFRFTSRCLYMHAFEAKYQMGNKWEEIFHIVCINILQCRPTCRNPFRLTYPARSVHHWAQNFPVAFQSIVFSSIKLSITNEGLCTHAYTALVLVLSNSLFLSRVRFEVQQKRPQPGLKSILKMIFLLNFS